MSNGNGLTFHKVAGVAVGIMIGGALLGIVEAVISMGLGVPIFPDHPGKKIARRAGFYVP